MKVHRPAARCGEDVAGEDAPVGHDERHVGVLFGNPRGKLARTYFSRLMYVEAELESGLLDWRCGELQASARRPIWLANNSRNFSYLRERAQRRDRNRWGTEENRTHGSRAYSPGRLKAKAIVPLLSHCLIHQR